MWRASSLSKGHLGLLGGAGARSSLRSVADMTRSAFVATKSAFSSTKSASTTSSLLLSPFSPLSSSFATISSSPVSSCVTPSCAASSSSLANSSSVVSPSSTSLAFPAPSSLVLGCRLGFTTLPQRLPEPLRSLGGKYEIPILDNQIRWFSVNANEDVIVKLPKQGKKSRLRTLRRFLLSIVVIGIAGVVFFQTLTKDDETWQLLFFETLPLRAMSRLQGAINHLQLPHALRAPIYRLWTFMFGCNLDEMRFPLDEYHNLAEFFGRPLKDGVRPIANADVISPADGIITSAGELIDGKSLEQIKGMSYTLEEFIGFIPAVQSPDYALYYCTIYIAPGDYHRMHAPANFNILARQHFVGELFPVTPSLVHYVPKLFTRNERVALSGVWQYGFMAFVPVGAYNVGSIIINFDPYCATNLSYQKPKIRRNIFEHLWGAQSTKPIDAETKKQLKSPYKFFRMYEDSPNKIGHAVTKGEEIARFEMGSTVVVVFEAPKYGFEFKCRAGDKIQVGQPIALCKPPSPPASATNKSATPATPATPAVPTIKQTTSTKNS